ncbi:MAG: RDD family protein [Verrucomicrobiota bacterium]
MNPNQDESGWISPSSMDEGEEEQESDIVSPFQVRLGEAARDIPTETEQSPFEQAASELSVAQSQEPLPELAPFLQRIAAKLVDWILCGALLIGGLVTWTLVGLPIEERSSFLSTTAFFFAPSFWAVWMIYNLGSGGRTLGKRAFGLRVVIEENGREMGRGRNFGRIWAETLSWGLCSLGYFFAFLDSEKRSMHDHFAGTRVVHRG